MASPLADLDELILKCRDEKAKSYIKESVSCYKLGAFRSAIVSCWIAVTFDVIDKLKELALAGDTLAQQELDTFEKAIATSDYSLSLKFERNLLELAQTKLELISPTERIDLERLQEDRNRCAHPSMNADGGIFDPSAELARAHIRSAVEHLLQHPPAQGKYALNRVLEQINSEYFPQSKKLATEALSKSPLAKCRSSLVRNLTIVITKEFCERTIEFPEFTRKAAALAAIHQLHRETTEKTLSEKLSELLRKLSDKDLYRAINLISATDFVEPHIDHDIIQKLTNYIENLPTDRIELLEDTYSIEKLHKPTIKRIRRITKEELENTIFWAPPPELCDRILEIYKNSKNFDEANKFGDTIKIYLNDFSEEQILKLIEIAGHNEQISYSWNFESIINKLAEMSKIDHQKINETLKSAKLDRFIQTKET